ncbi:MAG TPA: septum site-determining protein MinC [Bacillota bacterium]|nr:septum site-determining protein MinC [Bacillota bacterium]
MSANKQRVTIKGTRDGLNIFIEDTCSFHEAMADLHEKIVESERTNDKQPVPVTVKIGNRYVDNEQQTDITELIETNSNLQVKKIESNVIHKEQALAWKEESEVKIVNRMIRSGQVLDIKGDLLLIGDVNPGGLVISTGNIYIMGNLFGIAHAGSGGDRKAIIAASYMKPSQLRIADYISRAPDYDSEGVYMECGFIDEKIDQIIIDRLQVLSTMRKDLSAFERRMFNG